MPNECQQLERKLQSRVKHCEERLHHPHPQRCRECVWKYTDMDNSESESDSRDWDSEHEYVSRIIIINSFHFNFPFFNLCSSTKYKTNILIGKSILSDLNCQSHFLVEHKTMVYLILNGILRFNETQCFQHRGEGIYLKSSFTTDHSHTESLTYSTASFQL